MTAYSPFPDIAPFQIARLPRIVFGAGKISELPGLIAGYGRRVLLVTGAKSFQSTPHWQNLLQALQKQGIAWEHESIAGEPSPQGMDASVQRWRGAGIEVVAGIGGGSALDAAKAIAGLLLPGNSVMDHLEGVGPELPYHGPALPWIAVPTTAGTGSEATKNAVLSVAGENGFKKSFRHDLLVAQVALLDPDLLASCPPPLIAADGMDAFTQLLESYVSLNANPLTDALAVSGMQAFRDGFWETWRNPATAAAGRGRMAYASLLSGITLAQTGLGSVHGLAAPLGAFFPCPHGVACGTLVAEATEMNIAALRVRKPDSPALPKYAYAGRLLAGKDFADDAAAHAALVDLLREWTAELKIPRLSAYGMSAADIPRVVANSRGSSMKTNPLALTDAELVELLGRRL